MRDGWMRTGRPAAGWMAPSFFAAAFVQGVRGNAAAYGEWWEPAEIVCLQSRKNSFSLFVEPRVALHLGDLEAARAASALALGPMAGQYGTYATATAAEVAVAAGAADAEEQLVAAIALGAENDFVAAQLLRVAGRLHGDIDRLQAAAQQFASIGARFEQACTLFLVPERRAEAVADLAALGCPPPAA